MENGETVQPAAARECHGEALARVQIGTPLSIVHLLGTQQVHVLFRAELREDSCGPGPADLEVKLVNPGEIPSGAPAQRRSRSHLMIRCQSRFTAVARSCSTIPPARNEKAPSGNPAPKTSGVAQRWPHMPQAAAASA